MKLKRHIAALTVFMLCVNLLCGCTLIDSIVNELRLPPRDASIGIIGGADGPTAIYVTQPEETAQPTHATDPLPEITPEPVPVVTPTPEPTPEPAPLPTKLRISADYSAEDILALGSQTQLELVLAYESREYEALSALKEMLPGCDIRWCYKIGNVNYDISATEITLDSMDKVRDVLKYLPNIKKLDITACTPGFDEMDSLMADYPDVEFLWIVRFEDFAVRSDITIFSTLCMPDRPTYTSEMLEPLFKYCKHLRALDLGHNLLTDLSLLGTLPELQVLILADNRRITDISPLANLKSLEYLECFTLGDVEDFSCFNELTNLKALNCSNLKKLDSLDFIENMPGLEILWIYWFNAGLREQLNEKIAQHPEINIKYYCNYNGESVTCCGWRTTEMNCAIREAFANYDKVIEYVHWDNVIYKPGEYIIPTGPWVEH